MPIVVADASPLIYLAWIGQIDLFRRLYGSVLIPRTVWEEVTGLGAGLPGSKEVDEAVLAGWIHVQAVQTSDQVSELAGNRIDRGEMEAITLAVERHAVLVIDDLDGRSVARRLGVEVTGTLGVLARAKQEGAVHEIRPLVLRLKQETNFRVATALVNSLLKEAGERPI